MFLPLDQGLIFQSIAVVAGTRKASQKKQWVTSFLISNTKPKSHQTMKNKKNSVGQHYQKQVRDKHLTVTST